MVRYSLVKLHLFQNNYPNSLAIQIVTKHIDLLRMSGIKRKSIARNSIFLILPVTFLVLCLNLSHQSGPFSHRNYDPEFIYLFNGICLGELKIDLGHIDNPGTPLQIITAIVTRITHLFIGDETYAVDVLKHPDTYLHIVNVFNIAISSLVIFVCGTLIFQIVNNVFLVLLIQLSPLASITIIVNSIRIFPEVLTVIPIMGLCYLLIRFINNNNPQPASIKFILNFAVVSALGLTLKLDYFPLILIPLFIIPTWRKKGVYLLVSMGLFFVFAFPVLRDLNFFFGWIKSLIIHSGRYGSGDANFIETNTFTENIKTMIAFYKPFYYTLAACLLALLAVIIKKGNSKKIRSFRVLGALLVAMILYSLIVAKHFSLHYMIPAIYLTTLMIALIIKILFQSSAIATAASVTVIVVFFSILIPDYNRLVQFKRNFANTKVKLTEATQAFINTKPFLIVAQPYDTHFKEVGLLCGWFFTGKQKPYFQAMLKKIYPDKYVFDAGYNKFFYWGEFYEGSKIADKYDEFYIFFDSRQMNYRDSIFIQFGDNLRIDTISVQDTKDIMYKISH